MARRLRLTSDTSLKQWAAVAAIAIVGGCSWFSDEPSPPPAPITKQSSTVGTSGTIPDVNTVPNQAPTPTISSVDQAQQGLGSDSSNAQYADELTMPNAQAPRPEAPAAEPEPVAAPEAAAPAAPAVQQQAQVTQAPLPTAAAPAMAPQPVVAGAVPAPQLGANGALYQQLAGTPQQGAMPFEPSGELVLANDSTRSGKSVTVDYSAISSGGSVGYAAAPRFPYANPAQAMYRSPYGLTAYGPSGIYGPGVYGPGVYGGAAYGAYGYGQPTGVVYFNNGSARLSGDDRRILRQIAETQQAYGGVIRVVAHASQRTGNMNLYRQDETNRKISIARANAVANALVKYGVHPSLVQVAAAGDDQPMVYPESMPVGEAVNRRAEIYLSAY